MALKDRFPDLFSPAQQAEVLQATDIAQRFPELGQAPPEPAIQNELITSGDIPDLSAPEPVLQAPAPRGDDPTAPGVSFPNPLQDFAPTRAILDAQQAAETGTARGAIKFAGGAGQLAAGVMERLGIAPAGQSARVTQGAQTLQEQVAPLSDVQSEFAPIVQGAETLTQAAPLAAVGLPSATGSAILQSGALGAASGASSFINNPDEAGLSLERGTRALIGGAAGIVLPAAAAAGGAAKQAFGKSDVPRQLTTRIKQAGPESLSRREALLAKESLDAGFPTTPSAAANSKVIAGKETNVTPFESRQFKAETAAKQGESAGQRLTDDFLDSVLPERGAAAPVKEQVTALYNSSKGDLFDPAMLEGRLREGNMQKTFGALLKQFDKSLKNDQVVAVELAKHPQNSIGRLDAMKKFIDKQLFTTDKTPAFKRLGETSVKAVRRALISVGDDSSSTYSQARNLAHRDNIVKSIDKRLAGKAVGDDAPISSVDVSPVDFFNGVLKTKKQMTELFKDLRDIKDPTIRAESVAKARSLRRVLSRWQRTKPVLDKLSAGDTRTVQERSKPLQSAIFTAKRAIERRKSDEMVDFLTSDKWADDLLDGAIKAKSPVQFATELTNFMNIIGTKSPMAEDTAGTLGFEERE